MATSKQKGMPAQKGQMETKNSATTDAELRILKNQNESNIGPVMNARAMRGCLPIISVLFDVCVTGSFEETGGEKTDL